MSSKDDSKKDKKKQGAYRVKPKLDPFVEFGKEVKSFMSRSDLRNKKVKVELTEFSTVPTLEFVFDIRDTSTFRWETRALSRDAYIGWTTNVRRQSELKKGKDSWAKLLAKFDSRTATALTGLELEFPDGFQKFAGAAIVSSLTKMEKDIYNMSQKDYKSLCDADGLEVLLDLVQRSLGADYLSKRDAWIQRACREGNQPAFTQKPKRADAFALVNQHRSGAELVVFAKTQKGDEPTEKVKQIRTGRSKNRLAEALRRARTPGPSGCPSQPVNPAADLPPPGNPVLDLPPQHQQGASGATGPT